MREGEQLNLKITADATWRLSDTPIATVPLSKNDLRMINAMNVGDTTWKRVEQIAKSLRNALAENEAWPENGVLSVKLLHGQEQYGWGTASARHAFGAPVAQLAFYAVDDETAARVCAAEMDGTC